MTPEELSKLHPRLYHLTSAGAFKSIRERGLHSTRNLLHIWEVPSDIARELTTRRRARPTTIHHPIHGSATIADNAPLSEIKLAKALDDNISTSQWLEMLSDRIFFFADLKQLQKLSGAKLNRQSNKEVIEIDTLGLAKAYADRMEISPINSGNTNHQPARRGCTTFAPLSETIYSDWRRQRVKKSLDKIKEIAVRGSIPDVAKFVVGVTHLSKVEP